MDIEIPAVPIGIITIINLLAPYFVALINNHRWNTQVKKIIAIFASIMLTILAIGGYYWAVGEPISDFFSLIVLGILVSQTSYALLTKDSAGALEAKLNESKWVTPEFSIADEEDFSDISEEELLEEFEEDLPK